MNQPISIPLSMRVYTFNLRTRKWEGKCDGIIIDKKSNEYMWGIKLKKIYHICVHKNKDKAEYNVHSRKFYKLETPDPRRCKKRLSKIYI